MSHVIIEGTVIAAHLSTAFTTVITKHNFITAASNVASKTYPVMLISERH
jgi:hypothetical protein